MARRKGVGREESGGEKSIKSEDGGRVGAVRDWTKSKQNASPTQKALAMAVCV
jgi:hypothetical protein